MSRVRVRVPPRRLGMVWPYLPGYRVPFCDLAYRRLREHDMEFTLFSGTPSVRMASRGDATRAPWHRVVPESRLRAGKELLWRRLPIADLDLLILEQAIKNLENYPALIRQHVDGPGIAMWGHGRAYSTAQSGLAAAWKNLMTRRAQWSFVYTDSGARHLVEHGFPRTRLTVLRNTVDDLALRSDLARVTDGDVREFHRRLGTTPGNVALFIGAVDPMKGVDDLLTAAQRARDERPGTVTVICGDGPLADRVRRRANGSPALRYLGRVDGHDKAVALRAADILVAPRSLGLVVADSLIAGVPVVTVADAYHGPEADYLQSGVNCFLLPAASTSTDLGSACAALLADGVRLRELAQGSRSTGAQLSMTDMVERFVEGVLAWSEIRQYDL